MHAMVRLSIIARNQVIYRICMHAGTHLLIIAGKKLFGDLEYITSLHACVDDMQWCTKWEVLE